MIRAAALLLAAVVLGPASAGAGTPRSPLALTAAPAHVTLAGAARAEVNVTNSGLSAVVVDVVRAGFSLDLRGRPRVVPGERARAAASWLTVAPRRFVLDPGTTRSLTVTSRLPRRVEPGDHDALVQVSRFGFGVQEADRLGPHRLPRELDRGQSDPVEPTVVMVAIHAQHRDILRNPQIVASTQVREGAGGEVV